VIPNADASAAIVNAIILPLLFLSGIFIPFGNDTPGLDSVDRPDLPGQALRRRDAGRVHRDGAPLDRRAGGRRLGMAGLALALRFFSWEPRRS
jgi:hypothetical protein